MRITVITVDPNEPALVRGTSALGWRGKFGCPLVVGEAVFIPARGHEDRLRSGAMINVETGHESISEFKILSEVADGMRPLDCAGDYAVCGHIVHVAPQGIARVSVRGLTFELERSELNDTTPKVGDSVEFLLHGLSLWDSGQ